MKRLALVFVCIAFALRSVALASKSGLTGFAIGGSSNPYLSNFNSNAVRFHNSNPKLTRAISQELDEPYGLRVDSWATCMRRISAAATA